MMQEALMHTLNLFNERKQKINIYIKGLKALEKRSSGQNLKALYFNDDFLKILKANTLLMIYNLVECTVREGITEIYDEVKQEGLTYYDVSQNIKNIWFSYKFQQVYDPGAGYDSYKSKALEIVNSILNGDVIELNRKAMGISGNLDADQIRAILKEHGIYCHSEPGSNGGNKLKTVKQKRNYLAHGTISFAECGRDYGIDDLIQTNDQTVLFLEGLIKDMKQYYEEKRYKLK